MAEKVSKKLPKRVGNQHRKSKRAESWARGQDRKKARREAQEAAHALNVSQAHNA